jgi:hypothetical protein
MKPFELLLVYGVVEFIGNLKPSDRIGLHRKLLQIKDSPHNNSEQTVTEPQGRSIESSTWRRFCIRYWIDHADREVKILDVYLKE